MVFRSALHSMEAGCTAILIDLLVQELNKTHKFNLAGLLFLCCVFTTNTNRTTNVNIEFNPFWDNVGYKWKAVSFLLFNYESSAIWATAAMPPNPSRDYLKCDPIIMLFPALQLLGGQFNETLQSSRDVLQLHYVMHDRAVLITKFIQEWKDINTVLLWKCNQGLILRPWLYMYSTYHCKYNSEHWLNRMYCKQVHRNFV